MPMGLDAMEEGYIHALETLIRIKREHAPGGHLISTAYLEQMEADLKTLKGEDDD